MKPGRLSHSHTVEVLVGYGNAAEEWIEFDQVPEMKNEMKNIKKLGPNP